MLWFGAALLPQSLANLLSWNRLPILFHTRDCLRRMWGHKKKLKLKNLSNPNMQENPARTESKARNGRLWNGLVSIELNPAEMLWGLYMQETPPTPHSWKTSAQRSGQRLLPVHVRDWQTGTGNTYIMMFLPNQARPAMEVPNTGPISIHMYTGWYILGFGVTHWITLRATPVRFWTSFRSGSVSHHTQQPSVKILSNI